MKKKDKTQIYKIIDEKEHVTADNPEIERIITNCCRQLYTNMLEHLEELTKFLNAN